MNDFKSLRKPILVKNRFRIIAHRGASAYAPENTMAAFARADRMGVREVELDVQFSHDRHLVICHDRTLDRYGHAGILLERTSLHELQALDMGSWFSPEFKDERMLTLDRLFRQFGRRFVYHVEIKAQAPGIEKDVLSAIEAHGLQDAVIISSFHEPCLEAVKKLAPSMPLAWLIRDDGLSRENLERAAALGCQHVCPRASDLTSERVAEAHRIFAEVRAFAVKTPEDAALVVNTHCDGCTVDAPDWFAHEAARTETMLD